ncbi:2-phospho-L-lactate guanylyltransferase [Halorubrum sp. DTA98]|uniref:2-phospho-L-lactate guanylyltransferase n=1 Tax=Halorubrum sp. DTA98 TaxID=3402163 RepID=UPI003AAA2919
MEVLVPFSSDRPKSRLSGTLSSSERESLARAMLADVVEAIAATGESPRVLATEPVGVAIDTDAEVPVTVDERALTTAVNDAIADPTSTPNDPGDPRRSVAVVMADLALATPGALRQLFDADGDVVIAPGRGGGTNALVIRHPSFRVDYHGASYLDHLRIAADVGATVREIDSHRLATDIDESDDLAELLVHGDGRAATLLREAGFELDRSRGRVGVRRE